MYLCIIIERDPAERIKRMEVTPWLTKFLTTASAAAPALLSAL